MAAAYLIIADTVLYCCGRRDHPIGDGRSDGHSEAQRHSEAHSSEPVLTLSPVWEKQVFWETIFPCYGKRGKKVVKSQLGEGGSRQLCPPGRPRRNTSGTHSVRLGDEEPISRRGAAPGAGTRWRTGTRQRGRASQHKPPLNAGKLTWLSPVPGPGNSQILLVQKRFPRRGRAR